MKIDQFCSTNNLNVKFIRFFNPLFPSEKEYQPWKACFVRGDDNPVFIKDLSLKPEFVGLELVIILEGVGQTLHDAELDLYKNARGKLLTEPSQTKDFIEVPELEPSSI